MANSLLRVRYVHNKHWTRGTTRSTSASRMCSDTEKLTRRACACSSPTAWKMTIVMSVMLSAKQTEKRILMSASTLAGPPRRPQDTVAGPRLVLRRHRSRPAPTHLATRLNPRAARLTFFVPTAEGSGALPPASSITLGAVPDASRNLAPRRCISIGASAPVGVSPPAPRRERALRGEPGYDDAGVSVSSSSSEGRGTGW